MDSNCSFESVLQDVENRAMAQLARDGGVELGMKKCPDCGKVIAWREDFACLCASIREAKQSEMLRSKVLRRAYATIPGTLEWARRDNPRFQKLTLNPLALQIVRWSRRSDEVFGNVILSGPTNSGKTICCVALLHKILDHAAANEVGTVDLDFAKRVRFISALDLVTARRDSGLGAEPEEVREAKYASLLVLDELGHEAYAQDRDSTLLEVADWRYREGLWTIVTTGRTEKEFRAKYGAAVMRRLTHRGTGFVSMWEGEK